jgi:hypothetical protein
MRLRQYDDILDAADVYAFLALVGFYSSFFGTCSKVSMQYTCCSIHREFGCPSCPATSFIVSAAVDARYSCAASKYRSAVLKK